MSVVLSDICEPGEPHEHVLALSHWEARKGVLGRLSLEHGKRSGTACDELRLDGSIEDVGEVLGYGSSKWCNRGDEESGRNGRRADTRPIRSGKHESGGGLHWAEQEHVVGVDHRVVRSITVCAPGRPIVECRQRCRARLHVCETTQPREDVGPVNITKLGNELHAGIFLSLDELPLEKRDQRVTLSGVQCVAAQLNYWATSSPGCRHPGQTLACRPTNLSAAFSSVSVFLQNANRVTDFPNSGRE
jgi:hypothetical protein